jgi:hypothetical protein
MFVQLTGEIVDEQGQPVLTVPFSDTVPETEDPD